MNRAAAFIIKERARAVGEPRGGAVWRDRAATKTKRVNTFALVMSEGNRPAGAAAGAGMAAAVRRVKAETRDHDRDAIIVIPITGLWGCRIQAGVPTRNCWGLSAARELPFRKIRHVGTGHIRTQDAART